MRKIKRLLAAALLAAMTMPVMAYRHDYTTVEGDPLHTLQYTLPNGLKVYMTVNKDQPRIQTYIAVRVGGKNDPAETTGLAHYFEHLMFKGTQQFGTKDYAAEKPMLDRIEQLFETYRQTSDSTARAAIYHDIDSISYAASLIAIPNEYDKLMASIGANGTNAYTSTDVTCYVEDIPSNQIENWALIQADRFRNPVLRGFHTELETIYEEKNMSLTNDSRKAIEAILAGVFPMHPYGTQTVLGTQEHLKNPSITNVKNYHKQWYVPNNMAVCLSGDFDPDEMIDILTKYFGDMQPNANLPVLDFPEQPAITSPIVKEVKGVDAETLYMAWRIPEAKSKDMLVLNVLGEVLQNGKCGIIDVNVTLPQKLLGASSFMYSMADGGAAILYGRPKQGQTLDDVRDILLEQVAELRAGNFDESLLPAIVNNMKLSIQQQLESNGSRASMYVDAFVNGVDWKDEVAQLEEIDKVTKEDVIAAANKYLGPDSYVAVYKRQGKDENEAKIAKPKLTPIATNRDASSEFLTKIRNTKVEPIEPVFLDFNKDLTFGKTNKNGIEVIYSKNATNDIFSLTFVYELGASYDRALGYASAYLNLLGTPDMSAEQVKAAFYNLACTYRVVVQNDRTYVMISGLSENMDKALALYEKLVAEVQPDAEVWAQYADRIAKSMTDAKDNQSQNFSRLVSYARYGSPENNPSLLLQYTPDELKALDSKLILDALKSLNNYKQRVIYYGPQDLDAVIAAIDREHRTPDVLVDAPKGREFKDAQPTENVVFVAPYDAKQLYMRMLANRGEKFDADTDADRQLYNEYFGGGMNSIVFQEMRESRSLAYSAFAQMAKPAKADRPYVFFAQIATQNDKLGDALDAFDEIINEMPQSEAAFSLAKEGLGSRLRTERTIKDNIAWAWIFAQDLGIDYDANKNLFAALPGITLADVVDYQKKNVKDNVYHYAILGNIEDLDMDKLKSLGKVVILTTEDIFGY